MSRQDEIGQAQEAKADQEAKENASSESGSPKKAAQQLQEILREVEAGSKRPAQQGESADAPPLKRLKTEKEKGLSSEKTALEKAKDEYRKECAKAFEKSEAEVKKTLTQISKLSSIQVRNLMAQIFHEAVDRKENASEEFLAIKKSCEEIPLEATEENTAQIKDLIDVVLGEFSKIFAKNECEIDFSEFKAYLIRNCRFQEERRDFKSVMEQCAKLLCSLSLKSDNKDVVKIVAQDFPSEKVYLKCLDGTSQRLESVNLMMFASKAERVWISAHDLVTCKYLASVVEEFNLYIELEVHTDAFFKYELGLITLEKALAQDKTFKFVEPEFRSKGDKLITNLAEFLSGESKGSYTFELRKMVAENIHEQYLQERAELLKSFHEFLQSDDLYPSMSWQVESLAQAMRKAEQDESLSAIIDIAEADQDEFYVLNPKLINYLFSPTKFLKEYPLKNQASIKDFNEKFAVNSEEKAKHVFTNPSDVPAEVLFSYFTFFGTACAESCYKFISQAGYEKIKQAKEILLRESSLPQYVQKIEKSSQVMLSSIFISYFMQIMNRVSEIQKKSQILQGAKEALEKNPQGPLDEFTVIVQAEMNLDKEKKELNEVLQKQLRFIDTYNIKYCEVMAKAAMSHDSDVGFDVLVQKFGDDFRRSVTHSSFVKSTILSNKPVFLARLLQECLEIEFDPLTVNSLLDGWFLQIQPALLTQDGVDRRPCLSVLIKKILNVNPSYCPLLMELDGDRESFFTRIKTRPELMFFDLMLEEYDYDFCAHAIPIYGASSELFAPIPVTYFTQSRFGKKPIFDTLLEADPEEVYLINGYPVLDTKRYLKIITEFYSKDIFDSLPEKERWETFAKIVNKFSKNELFYELDPEKSIFSYAIIQSDPKYLKLLLEKNPNFATSEEFFGRLIEKGNLEFMEFFKSKFKTEFLARSYDINDSVIEVAKSFYSNRRLPQDQWDQALEDRLKFLINDGSFKSALKDVADLVVRADGGFEMLNVLLGQYSKLEKKYLEDDDYSEDISDSSEEGAGSPAPGLDLPAENPAEDIAFPEAGFALPAENPNLPAGGFAADGFDAPVENLAENPEPPVDAPDFPVEGFEFLGDDFDLLAENQNPNRPAEDLNAPEGGLDLSLEGLASLVEGIDSPPENPELPAGDLAFLAEGLESAAEGAAPPENPDAPTDDSEFRIKAIRNLFESAIKSIGDKSSLKILMERYPGQITGQVEGECPLIHCAAQYSKESLELILEKYPEQLTRAEKIYGPESPPQMPIHSAVSWGNQDCCKFLLERMNLSSYPDPEKVNLGKELLSNFRFLEDTDPKGNDYFEILKLMTAKFPKEAFIETCSGDSSFVQLAALNYSKDSKNLFTEIVKQLPEFFADEREVRSLISYVTEGILRESSTLNFLNENFPKIFAKELMPPEYSQKESASSEGSEQPSRNPSSAGEAAESLEGAEQEGAQK